jgi:hypothetical protein
VEILLASAVHMEAECIGVESLRCTSRCVERGVMSKIGLYGFDKDKIPCQSPIHTVNISIREIWKS